jgi:hypothetical protein
MPRLPSAKVQRVAAHLAYYIAKGFTDNEASERLARDFGLVPQNTQEAAFRYAHSAVYAFNRQNLVQPTSTINDLYGGAEQIPSGRIGLRVLATYFDDDGNFVRTASKVVSTYGSATIKSALDEAENSLLGEDSLPSAGSIELSIISSVPFPPQSEQ